MQQKSSIITRARRPEPRRPVTRAAVWAALLLAAFWWPASRAEATPLISEVFYDAVGADDGQVFVELSGAPGTLLTGLALEGVNGANGVRGPRVELVGVISADGLFVVADRRSDQTSDVVSADLLLNFDLQNGPDSVVLVDGDERVLDALAYGTFGSGETPAGEGAPAEDPPAGWSLQRRWADVDSGDNASDFVASEIPSPGMADFFAVPEPAPAQLAWVGLLLLGLLARARRRRRGAPA